MTDEQVQYVTVNTLADWAGLGDGATVRVNDSGTPVSCDLYVSERGTRHWYTTMENRSDGNGHGDAYMHEVYGPGIVLTPAPTPQTPDNVREAVARAIRNVGIGPLGPNTIEIAQRGGDIYMTPDEAMRCADAAMSATRRPTVSGMHFGAIDDLAAFMARADYEDRRATNPGNGWPAWDDAGEVAHTNHTNGMLWRLRNIGITRDNWPAGVVAE